MARLGCLECSDIVMVAICISALRMTMPLVTSTPVSQALQMEMTSTGWLAMNRRASVTG